MFGDAVGVEEVVHNEERRCASGDEHGSGATHSDSNRPFRIVAARTPAALFCRALRPNSLSVTESDSMPSRRRLLPPTQRKTDSLETEPAGRRSGGVV